MLNFGNSENVKDTEKILLLPVNWLKNKWLIEVELNNN